MTRRAFCLAGLLLIGAAAAQPVAYDYARFDLPDGWVRDEETRYASFSSPDGAATIAILTRLGDDDADDLLESFVSQVEVGETSIERSEPEDLSNDDFAVVRQMTLSRDAGGRMIQRLYTAADPDETGVVIVAAAERSVFAGLEPDIRATLASMKLVSPKQAAPAPQFPEARPGDGGLDGLYTGSGERSFLDFAGGVAWHRSNRLALYYFDPLGEVYRGAPARFDIALFGTCGAADAWRCGRYRLEGDVIALRWADGTMENRPFARDGDRIRIGGMALDPPGALVAVPSGAFAYVDSFNTGYWLADAQSTPTIRFLDDGHFELGGVSGFASARVGEGIAATGRVKMAGRTLTLVYATGASEVIGIASFSAFGRDVLLLGGRIFARAPTGSAGDR